MEAEARAGELERQANSNDASEPNEGSLDCSENSSSEQSAFLTTPARGHSFPIEQILICRELMLHVGTSLRGVGKVFSLFKRWLGFEQPAATTVRNWMLRIGLYLLNRPLEQADDWILIADATSEWGGGKCLVVLAVRRSQLNDDHKTLRHQDTALLWLEVRNSWTGEAIYEILSHLALRCGVPVQFVSDHGSDLLYAVNHMCQDHPTMRATYDVTHALGRLVVAQLEEDEAWDTFTTLATQTRKTLSYGPEAATLHFLTPPSQASATRCEHVDSLSKWGVKLLDYAQRGDFSKIDATYTFDKQAIAQLDDQLEAETLAALVPMQYRWRDDESTFRTALQQCLGEPTYEQIGDQVVRVSDLGRRKFELHFNWVSQYDSALRTKWQPLSQVLSAVEYQVKHDGLHKFSAKDFASHLHEADVGTDDTNSFVRSVLCYLGREGKGLARSASLLGSSDVIESLFGKYKSLTEKKPIQGFGSDVLLLPLLTETLTPQLAQQALETIREADVTAWVKQKLGCSSLAKLRHAFT